MGIDVSIIIINWNTKDFVNDCLNAVPDACKGLNYEIIVIDNASCDGSYEFIKSKYPDIKVVGNKDNLGFSRACNQAAKIAQGEYYFLLNPDTIPQKGSIFGLVDFIKGKARVGAVGPRMITGGGRTENSVRQFPTMRQILVRDTILGKLMPWVRTPRLIKSLPLDKPSLVEHVSGGALLTKAEIWKKLNGMDTRFFMFYEDVDLCRRIKEIGYNVYYLPTVEVVHLGGGSRHQDRSSAFYYSIKSRFLYCEKYYSGADLWIFKVLYKPLFLIQLFVDLAFKSPFTVYYRARSGFLKKYLWKFISL